MPRRAAFQPSGAGPSGATGRRLVRLYAGLALYGSSDALLIRAHVGLDPWDVFHQGLSRHTGLSIGAVSVVVGAAVLLLWWPIRQRPGLGTVSNVVLVGTFIDLTMAVVPQYEALAVRVPLMAAAVVLNGAATGLYITARFGPGPRDGLMTGLHRRTGRSLRLIRTGIELSVLAAGFVLGGGVGVGTVVYALAIGPLAQFFLKRFALPASGAEGAERAVTGREAGSAPVRGHTPEAAAVDTI
ncbi:membrane protein YczE [Actinacidiphila rubida]|nr:hypothetical protein [Actinacidiphila rubida]